MNPATTSPANAPATTRLYSHPGRPEWGRGLLVAERDKLLVIHWEDGKEHLVAATHRDRLTAVALPAAEEGVVVDKIKGMQARSTAPAARAKKSAVRAGRPVAPMMSFDAQLAIFESRFPGGFAGVKYSESERGVAGGTNVEGGKQWAIERARELLSSARFADPAALFESMVVFLRPPLSLVHPMEGAIPLKSIKDESARLLLVEALRDVLHGVGEYGPRFDRFVQSVQLPGKDGKNKRPGWPLVTLLPALYTPAERLFVKPLLMQKQALILKLKINYESMPSAAVYEEFHQLGDALAAKLRERGHAPRDLLDAAAFVWTTLSPIAPDAPPAAIA